MLTNITSVLYVYKVRKHQQCKGEGAKKILTLIINVALNIQSVILCILKERFSNLWSSDLITYTAAV